MKKICIHKMAEEDPYSLDLSAEEAAEKEGFLAVIPKEHQLQIDIDTLEAHSVFESRLMEYIEHSQCSVTREEHLSKSGFPHKHITLSVYNRDGSAHIFGEFERICLQAVLGSDIVRETLATWRLLRGSTNPSRFFEPKP